MGKRRSRGQGEAKLEVLEWSWPDLEQRAREVVAQGQALAEAVGGASQEILFVLDVTSPIKLLDETLRPSTDLVGWLRREPNLQEVRLVDSLGALDWSSGWDMAVGMPKPSQEVIAAGSVFVFAAPRGRAGEVARRLAELERSGLGEGWQEGFGAVSVNEPWRTERK